MAETRLYRCYDHRLKQLAQFVGDSSLFNGLDIPRSTIATWQSQGLPEVVTHESFDMDGFALQARILGLENEVSEWKVRHELLQTILEIFGGLPDYKRLPDGEEKAKVLEAIESALQVLPLEDCLETIGLSSSRYHEWKRKQAGCNLADYKSCPKVRPSQLLRVEVETIRELVTSKEYAHYPIRSLALKAMRIGKVVASPWKWYKLIREHNWRRPRKREYPEKPQVGIRASGPNQIWHIDLTILKLMDGTKVYIHACIDNFSRYVLSWKVADSVSALNTKELLRSALLKAFPDGGNLPPEVICDGGSENINHLIDKMVSMGEIILKIAQIDIQFSNSIVEALFRSMKNNYLYFCKLTSFAAISKFVDFYLTEHNVEMPHAAFNGATPEEVHYGQWDSLIEQTVPVDYEMARHRRVAYHRVLPSCGICKPK